MDGVAQELDVVEDWDNPTTNQEFCQNRDWYDKVKYDWQLGAHQWI